MTRIALLASLFAAGLSTGALAQAQETPTTPPDFATLDADGDGALTAGELGDRGRARAAAMFDAADADGDGSVTADEMVAMMEQRREQRMTAMAERMVERADTDGDGAVSRDEAMAAMEKMRGRMMRGGDGARREARGDEPGPGRKAMGGHGRMRHEMHRDSGHHGGMMDRRGKRGGHDRSGPGRDDHHRTRGASDQGGWSGGAGILLDYADANGDGTLDEAEYDALRALRQQGEAPAAPESPAEDPSVQ